MTANEYGVSFWGSENVDLVVIVPQHCEYTKLTESYTLKEHILWYVNHISLKLLL